GRAFYFSLGNFWPGCGSPWRAFDMSARAAPHEKALLNATAGVGWALVLVNMRHPEIIEALLERCGPRFSGDDGFVNGVASALVLRVVTTPADPYLARFCEHKPERPDVAQFWNGVIRPSCDQARRVSSLLQRQKRLETVFQ